MIDNAFKHALIALAITNESDVNAAKNKLEQAEDKTHPLNFVIRHDEIFTYHLRSTARKIRAEKARLNAVVVMEPMGETIEIDQFDQPSPFTQPVTGDGASNDGIELNEMKRPGV